MVLCKGGSGTRKGGGGFLTVISLLVFCPDIRDGIISD